MPKKTDIPTKARIAVKIRANEKCERCGMGCQGDWHHRRSRSVRDDETHTVLNGVYLCRTCHSWVHANPMLARGQGFIVSRYRIPSEEPFKHWSLGWVIPTDNGLRHAYANEIPGGETFHG